MENVACRAHCRSSKLGIFGLHLQISAVIVRGKTSGIDFIVTESVTFIVHTDISGYFAIFVFNSLFMWYSKVGWITVTSIQSFGKTQFNICSEPHQVRLCRNLIEVTGINNGLVISKGMSSIFRLYKHAGMTGICTKL